MTFQIRPATLADVQAKHTLRLAVRKNKLSDRRKITEASYLPYVHAGSAWVAVDRSQIIVGFAAVDHVTESVWALFVQFEQEGLGIGRALHATMLTWARKHGIRGFWLVTAPGTRAERFYVSAGWEKSGASGTREAWFVRRLGGDAV